MSRCSIVAAAFDPRLNGLSASFVCGDLLTIHSEVPLSDSTEANKDLAAHSSDPVRLSRLSVA